MIRLVPDTFLVLVKNKYEVLLYVSLVNSSYSRQMLSNFNKLLEKDDSNAEN